MSKVWYAPRRESVGLFMKSKIRLSPVPVGLFGILCGSYLNLESLLLFTPCHSFQVCAQRVNDKMNIFPEFESEKIYSTEASTTIPDDKNDGLTI